MGKHRSTHLTIVVVAAGAVLVAGAGPAFADTPGPLYVNNATGSNCADSGTGTQSQPYCTISAAVSAVVPGQTINVTGTYSEHVTIAKSGTAGQPITLQHLVSSPAARLSGADAGFTIDGQHDIAISGFGVTGVASGTAVALSNSTRIALETVNVTAAATGTVAGIQLAAVTDSSLVGVRTDGFSMTTGVALDAATTGVLVKSSFAMAGYTAGSKGIDISGSANTVLNTTAGGGTVAGIVLEPGAANNIVANDYVYGSRGVGISNIGATGTAITNNKVQDNCASGIRVSGASSGVSVQNNFAVDNIPYSIGGCDHSIADAVEIGVYDGAMGKTVVDYNCVYHGSAPGNPTAYAWNNTLMGLADFRAASGQAAHDLECPNLFDTEDSANSAAPGFQSTDSQGYPREDDLGRPNTGAGPITYADRGNTEIVGGPTAQLVVKADQHALSITADASTTTLGWLPAPIASYAFDFGDGVTATQATPIATHQYAKAGTYTVTLIVTDANAIKGAATAQVPLWTAARMKMDFNNDGNIDIAGIDANNDLKLYTGDGGGKLGDGGAMWPTGGLWAGFKQIAAGDFNNDGNVDVAGIDANNDMRLYTSDGTGKLTGSGTAMWPTGGLWAGFKQIAAGDFNNDGNVDIAGIDANNDIRLYIGNGTGTLTAPGSGTEMWPTGGLWAGFKHIVAGDFNNDGNVDIAGIDANNDIRLYTGNGAGKLVGSGPAMWPTGGRWAGFKHIVAGDFNNDGNVDIAGIDANNDMRLYTGDGAGKLTGSGTAMWPTGGLWAGFKLLT